MKHIRKGMSAGDKHGVCPWAKIPTDRSRSYAITPSRSSENSWSLANDAWRQSAARSVSIRDGLNAAYKDRKVRVLISGDIATVAIKGPGIGVRPEFEYEIPITDAERDGREHPTPCMRGAGDAVGLRELRGSSQ
jgi:hypothetical protein